MKHTNTTFIRLGLAIMLIAGLAIGCGSGGKTGGSSGGKQMRGLNTIFEAAQQGKLEAIVRFVADGENPNAVDQFGRTALHYAAEGNFSDVVTWLVYDGGANFNVRDGDGKTPLALAQDAGNNEVIAVLEEVGAQP